MMEAGTPTLCQKGIYSELFPNFLECNEKIIPHVKQVFDDLFLHHHILLLSLARVSA
jgi:hypothetical protein